MTATPVIPNARAPLSALDISDLWEMMHAAESRLNDAKAIARAAQRIQAEALREFESARQTYQNAVARQQIKGGAR